MHIRKQQKRFIAIAAVVLTAVLACDRINALVYSGASSGYPSSPQATLVSDTNQATSESEKLGRTCLPEEVSGARLIGEYEGSHELFQIWNLEVAHHPVLRISSLFGTVCGLAYDSRYNTSFGEDLPQEDARPLALIFYQHRVNELGGLAALQNEFDAEAATLAQSDGVTYLPPEFMWALEEIGVRLSSEFKALDPDNPPQMNRSTEGDG